MSDKPKYHDDSIPPARTAFDRLSRREAKAYRLLAKVPACTIIGMQIEQGLRSEEAFRTLVKELKDQARVAPRALKEAIGAEAFNAIIKCKL